MSNALMTKLSDQLPAHLQTGEAVGNENLDGSALAIPYISLLQSLSKPCTKGDSQYVKGAEAGMFFNSVTKEFGDELLCANMFTDTVFACNKKRALGDDYKGEHASAELAIAHLEEEGVNPNDYDITETHKHMLALFDEKTGELKSGAIYSFRNTALKSSRTWNTQILTEYPNADRFAGIWKLTPIANSNSKGTWYMPSTELVGYASEETYNILKDRYKQWRGQ